MSSDSSKTLVRDVDAVRIPSGEPMRLVAVMSVTITQSLGGSFTVVTSSGLARIRGVDADALGLEVPVEAPVAALPADGSVPVVDEGAVWGQLKTCFDPEIPVNIVDLGLIYDCVVEQVAGQAARVLVKMTLTAPGCGMGPVIAKEAEQKISALPGVGEASVEVVWDPPWNQSMISEVGKMQLGMI